jgi:tRNA(Ile)-lysidine synthetase-like protein
MDSGALPATIDLVPAGTWAVAVSGGADSVALLRLLQSRIDLKLHIVHLDHQTRGAASTADAQFVADLAQAHQVPVTIALRENVERDLTTIDPNPSARYRAARLALFQQVVEAHGLQGVLLAHHADDQAETILHRLLRGAGPAALVGMAKQTQLGPLQVLRPLLDVRRPMLRAFLADIGQIWREDASNESDDYLRNRLRRWLREDDCLHEALIEIGANCRQLVQWTSRTAPNLSSRFATADLERLPLILARESAHRWLLAQGAAPGELSDSVLDRLIAMAHDAASPAQAHFPGALLVRRQKGMIWAER